MRWFLLQSRGIRFVYLYMASVGIGMAVFLGKLPLFYRFHLPLDFEDLGGFWRKIVLLGLAIPDAYLFPLCWLNWLSFYTMLFGAGTQLRLYLKILNEGKVEPIKMLMILTQIQLVMTRFVGAFATALVTYMATMTSLILFCLYGSLNADKEQVFLIVFLLTHAVSFVPAMYILLLPLAKLGPISLSIIRKVQPASNMSRYEKELVIRLKTTLHPSSMSSGGIFKIDYDCLRNYFDFLIDYIVVILSI